MSLAIDIAVAAPAWDAVDGLDGLLRRAVDAAVNAAALPQAVTAEVSVLLCDDAAIRALNRTWRGQDKATNVLSFPADDAAPPGAPRLLGDIALAYETVAREASAEAKPLGDHVSHLLVHGFLHLLGHDHEDPGAATRMEALERRILADLGIGDPYAGSDPLPALAS